MNRSLFDRRVVYGVACMWWDDVEHAGEHRAGENLARLSPSVAEFLKHGTQGTLPVCPFCHGPLMEMPSEGEFLDAARYYGEIQIWPNYLDMVKWSKGRCFPSITELLEAYAHRDRERGGVT